MPRTLVGKLMNRQFAFFWLLIGGGIADIILVAFSLRLWQIFLPIAILSIVLMLAVRDIKKRPKIWLGLDLLLTVVLSVLFVMSFGSSLRRLTLLLPNALIILGCVLGIMNW